MNYWENGALREGLGGDGSEGMAGRRGVAWGAGHMGSSLDVRGGAYHRPSLVAWRLGLVEMEVLQLPHHGEGLDMRAAVVSWRWARWASGVGCSRCVGNQGQGGEEGVRGWAVGQMTFAPAFVVPLFVLVVTLHSRFPHVRHRPWWSVEGVKLPLGAM